MAKTKKQKRAEELISRMQDGNYDPLEELMKLAKQSRVKPELKLQIARELMQYRYPKLKAIEHDTKSEQPVVFNFDLSATQLAADETNTA